MKRRIKKKVIEVHPDGRKIVTIEYEQAPALFGPTVYPMPFVPVIPSAFSPRYEEPCAFDGLKDGIYGLVCLCPRCSPRFTSGTIATLPGTNYTS